MTREEAEKYADNMTYRDAINNLMKAKSIPYRKATFIKVNELLKVLEQEPCADAISREELLKAIDTWDKFGYTETGCFVREPKGDYVPYIHYDDVIKSIKGMPPVTPQYTDAEIQKMQDLEFAEIQKAYEIGKDEGSEVLDKIRAEIMDINIVRDEYSQRQNDYCDGVEFAKKICLQIIDKYKASPTGAERSEE